STDLRPFPTRRSSDLQGRTGQGAHLEHLGGGALGVAVGDDDAAAAQMRGYGQVDGGGGFARAAFAGDDGDGLHGSSPPLETRDRSEEHTSELQSRGHL